MVVALHWWDRRKALRMLEKGQLGPAVEYLREKGNLKLAVELLVDRGASAMAADLLEELGQLPDAAALRLAAGQYGKAGELYMRCGDLLAAATAFERDAQFVKSLKILLDLNDYGRAAILAVHHIEDSAVLISTARRLMKEHDKEAAVRLLDKAGCHQEAGRVYESLGRLDESLKAYERVGDLVGAAGIYAKQGEHKRAAYLLLKAGKTDQACDQLLLTGELLAAARACRRLGRHARAIEALEGLHPSSASFREGMLLASALLEELDRKPEAIEKLAKLLEVIGYAVDTEDIIFRMVDLQMDMGDLEGAGRTLDRAKEEGMESESIDEGLDIIRITTDNIGATKPTKPSLRQAASTTTVGFPRSERYLLNRKLARGGHGVLYLVYDQRLDRDVVLKLLHSESLPSRTAREYFEREARAAGKLEHDNIVRVYDCGTLQGRPYIAMEYVEGHTLFDLHYNFEPGLKFTQKIGVVLQLCAALEHAHSNSILHRDIKMENVMLTRDIRVKLLDFGLAKALDQNPHASAFIVGTPSYMSPEQVRGDFLDARTDIFSLGVLMYRLFTGETPYPDDGSFRHRFELPPDPRKTNSALPEVLSRAILGALQPNRDDRLPSAVEVARQVRMVLL